jgi:hypothetical protein
MGDNFFLRRLDKYSALPRCYGLAWHDYLRLEIVVAPIPLNVLFRLLRELWFGLRAGVFPDRWTRTLREAYRRGRDTERARYRDKYAELERDIRELFEKRRALMRDVMRLEGVLKRAAKQGFGGDGDGR